MFTPKQNREVDCSTLQIVTSRLRLSPVSREHADNIFLEFTPSITRYMGPCPATTIDETLSFVDTALEGMESNDNYQAVISLRDSGEFLGCCGLHGSGKPDRPELGVWIKESAHGRGYGKEAIIGLTEWATEAIELSYFTYPVDRRNLPSLAIPQALGGAVFDQESYRKADETPLDLLIYKIPQRDRLSVRMVEAADVQRLVEAFPEGTGPSVSRHVERFQLQVNGDVTCFAAWRSDVPLGSVFLSWSGGRGDRTKQADELGCAEINDLIVTEQARGQGIGRALMEAAETHARTRGVSLLGLEVTAANPFQNVARRLYTKMGYEDAGYGEVASGYTYHDPDGKAHRDEEIYVYLVKSLAA